ncbi:MAG: GNAT family N-acetyltransferase [Clostridia bacterium]|nr:GNAT family N-acetyltransferase [Clostridia bacterium]
MEIRIRTAEKQDAPRIAQLLETIAQLHHEGRPDIYAGGGAKYDVKAVEKKIKDKEEIIFVATDENDYVLGYTISKIYTTKDDGIVIGHKKMYIDDVCVDSQYRKHGIGKLLMAATKQKAIDENCHICELNVWAFNENAVKFYESCGMTKQRIYMEYIL